MDDEIGTFLRQFDAVAQTAKQFRGDDHRPAFSSRVGAHLGGPATDLPLLTENVPAHRYADWDVALARIAERDPAGEAIGVSGERARFPHTLAEYVSDGRGQFRVGQVDYVSMPTGPAENRRVIGLGTRLFRYDGVAVAVLQRQPEQMFGMQEGRVDVMASDEIAAVRLLDEARELASRHSVLRAKVVEMATTGFGRETDVLTFHPRPAVTAEEIILPDGTLDRVLGHVVGIAEHADELRKHGQHLKRGLLLYGPPGTGKTHTVRHLIARSPDHTVVLLSGLSLQQVTSATALARLLQPAMVVLEDCDLVAEDRATIQAAKPLLFAVLDAIDGLEQDADVTFVLTTNRVEVLERALAQRPGRVDLAVEVPLPDVRGRARLIELYAGDVDYSAEAVAAVVDRTDGQTASFFKELLRRSVLRAAASRAEPGDGSLRQALTDLLAERDALARSMLGEGGEFGPFG